MNKSASLGSPVSFDAARVKDLEHVICQFDPDQSEVLVGIAGCSPYLSRIIETESAWLRSALQQDDQDCLAKLCAIGEEVSVNNLPSELRRRKKRLAILTAFYDCAGLWSVEQVTRALSDFADAVTHAGIVALLDAERARGKLPDVAACRDYSCGMVALAMGKHGARELNYSSDIDLIMLYDDERYEEDLQPVVRRVFVRVTQRLVKLLSDVTAEGYVFRVDLRLRPDPAVTPVCISMDAAERYYESLGRTWERAAMIKARPCAGDISAGEAFLERLSPFIWRRHLEFASIADAQQMLIKIREHKGLTGPISLPGHDMKLGRGGIREIEFYAQTHQLIFGGRENGLRHRETVKTLQALADAGRIPEETASRLIENYRHHRQLEHRLQMVDDAQTHNIPSIPEKFAQIAAFCGYAHADQFESRTVDRLNEVHKLTDLQGSQQETTPERVSPFSDELSEMEDRWAKRPVLRSSRARGIYKGLRKDLLRRFEQADDPHSAMVQFDRFLSALPSGVQLFSLFDANPKLLDLVLDICATAPDLARYLGRNPGVLDAVLDPDFYAPLPDFKVLERDLQTWLENADSYESVLDLVRVWQKEQHFRVGVHLLRGLSAPTEIALGYSNVAEASVAAILPHVSAHLVQRYGKIAGDGAVVIGMGKLGSRDMTAESDLDLIIVYDAPDGASSDGRKSLSASAYYARFTQALISGLTAPTAEGQLYEVDMRLRPSGRQGPIATRLEAFAHYQLHDAWTWEHLALTRAHVVAGPHSLSVQVEGAIDAALARKVAPGKVLSDIAEMRQRLRDEKTGFASNPWEVKHGAGRLMDIELLVQGGALICGLPTAQQFSSRVSDLEKDAWLTTDDAELLQRAYSLYVAVQHVTRLVGNGFDPDAERASQKRFLLAATARRSIADLKKELADTAADCASLISQKLQSG